jgi:cation:H+ antiporter
VSASLIQFLLSALVIVAAGAAVTLFGDAISQLTKLGGLLIGSILIAGATSLPELGIDINAVRMGSPDLAVGDLLGSGLFNLLILAVLDLTRYSHGQMLSKVAASHALAGCASIMLTATAGIFLLLGPKLEGVTILRVGPGTLAIVAVYIVCVRIVYFAQREVSPPVKEPKRTPSVPWLGPLSLKGAIFGYVIAGAIILAAAPFLAKAADDLAERSGLGGSFFGTTFVALCTSLPEVVTTFVAVRMKAFDLAVGNIFGSNCFNMLILFPLDLVDEGSLLSSVSSTHVYTAFAVIIVTIAVILGQLYPAERKRHFLEPDALMTLVLIMGALTGLYFLR